MAITVLDMYDTTGDKVSQLPAGHQVAGYTTGSAGVKWTPAQFAAFTNPTPAVRIDQDSSAADPTADILDVENGAATVAEIPHWITLARQSFNSGMRLGQRWPGVYCATGTLTAAVNILTQNNLTNVPFGIADLTNRTDAITKVSTATGPYPRVWQQYAFGGSYDSGIVALPWLQNVSVKPVQHITQDQWRWCNKCQALFYGPHQALSGCPKGGTHEGGQSGNYVLNDIV